jgi:hypothetical protein
MQTPDLLKSQVYKPIEILARDERRASPPIVASVGAALWRTTVPLESRTDGTFSQGRSAAYGKSPLH